MKKLIIFTDIGDTIIDEGSQVLREFDGLVLAGNCIPGARETMLTLHEMGYTIAMVADGRVESFWNLMDQNGLTPIFDFKSISESVGTEKPDFRMFDCAFRGLGLSEEDKKRIIMVGNNVERDIVGAKRFGIRSVHINWTDRYPKAGRCPEEVADYTISKPEELLALVERLEREL